jgi:predicted aconitase
MHLSGPQERAIKGANGEAFQLAMEILVKVGEAFGAGSLVPITSAHVLAHYSSLHDAGTQLLEKFADSGGRFHVPTTVDPASIDLQNWRDFGIPESYARRQFRLCRAYEKLGGIPCWTCTQYQSCNIPRPGETLAWAESSSVVFANSLLSCRTNRMTVGLDVACAITGLTPRFGMLLDEKRTAEVGYELGFKTLTDLDYRSVGYFIGKSAGARVPAITGLPKEVTADQLKHLGAGAAAAGPISMIHYVGLTPGSKTMRNAAGPNNVETREITRTDLENIEAELNQTDEKPDLVCLGVPHLSIQELQEISILVSRKKLRRDVQMWLYTSLETYTLAEFSGIKTAIERTGARLTHSTDAEISPLGRLGFRTVMTNSSKLAEILPAEGEVKIRYLPLRGIVSEVMN